MLTIKNIFDENLRKFSTTGLELYFNDLNKNPLPSAIVRVCYDINTNSKFIKAYIPALTHYADYINLLYNTNIVQRCDLGQNDISRTRKIRIEGIGLGEPIELNSPDGGFEMLSGQQGFDDFQKISQTQFNKRVFFYIDEYIEKEKRDILIELGRKKGLFPVIRDKHYLDALTKNLKPLAFISHDSRDKESLVENLALKLTQRLCPVWYDEYSLKWGDKLRESIEKGLKETKYCIVVLSPNFISNRSWGKVEFDSIFAKNIDSEQNIILPIWHNVDKKMVKDFCMSLSSIVALKSNDPDLIDKIISKIKT